MLRASTVEERTTEGVSHVIKPATCGLWRKQSAVSSSQAGRGGDHPGRLRKSVNRIHICGNAGGDGDRDRRVGHLHLKQWAWKWVGRRPPAGYNRRGRAGGGAGSTGFPRRSWGNGLGREWGRRKGWGSGWQMWRESGSSFRPCLRSRRPVDAAVADDDAFFFGDTTSAASAAAAVRLEVRPRGVRGSGEGVG